MFKINQSIAGTVFFVAFPKNIENEKEKMQQGK